MLKRVQPVQPALEGEADTLLGLYIADMKGQNVALLTALEEQELARQARAGDAQAFDHLVRANLRLVVNLARKCAQGVGRGVPMVELIGEGNVGLMAAARRFDPSRNIRFSTYATPWIAQAIRHGAEEWGDYEESGMPHAARRNRRAQESSSDNPDSPDALLLMVRMSTSDTSDCDGRALRQDELLADPAPLPDEKAAQRILSDQVQGIIDAALTDRERTLIRQRYGMDGGGGCSFSEAGEDMGISRQRAHQIEVRAIGKLRQVPVVERLRDYADYADYAVSAGVR